MAMAAGKKKKSIPPVAGRKKAEKQSSIPFAWLFRRGNKKKTREPEPDDALENEEPEEVSVDVITRHSDGGETASSHEEPVKRPLRRAKRRRITEEAAIYNDLPEEGEKDAHPDIKPVKYDEEGEEREAAHHRRSRSGKGREEKRPGNKKKAGSGRAVLLLLLLLAGGGAYLYFTDGLGPILDAAQDLPALFRDVLSMVGL